MECLSYVKVPEHPRKLCHGTAPSEKSGHLLLEIRADGNFRYMLAWIKALTMPFGDMIS